MPPEPSHIIVNGREIAIDAIRAEVRAEFADRLKTARFLEKLKIRREIRAEIERRIRIQSPADALYLTKTIH